MGRGANAKTGGLKKKEALFEKMRTENHYFRYLYNLDVSMFGWRNLPEYIDPIYIEETFCIYGSIAAFSEPEIGVQMLRDIRVGVRDIYGRPTSWTCYGSNGFNFPGLNKSNSWIGYNNKMRQGDLNILYFYSKAISQIDSAIRSNARLQKVPFLIRGTPETVLSLKTIVSQAIEGVDVVVTDTTLNVNDGISVLDLKVPYVAEDLFLLKRRYINECFDLLGIDNANVDKKERLLEAEVNNGNSSNKIVRDGKLECRQDFADHVNSLFGTNIEPYLKGGGKIGNLYNDAGGDSRESDGLDDSNDSGNV